MRPKRILHLALSLVGALACGALIFATAQLNAADHGLSVLLGGLVSAFAFTAFWA